MNAVGITADDEGGRFRFHGSIGESGFFTVLKGFYSYRAEIADILHELIDRFAVQWNHS